jgi:hypothetical protein
MGEINMMECRRARRYADDYVSRIPPEIDENKVHVGNRMIYDFRLFTVEYNSKTDEYEIWLRGGGKVKDIVGFPKDIFMNLFKLFKIEKMKNKEMIDYRINGTIMEERKVDIERKAEGIIPVPKDIIKMAYEFKSPIDYREMKMIEETIYSAILPYHIESVVEAYNRNVDMGSVKTVIDATSHVGTDSFLFAYLLNRDGVEIKSIELVSPNGVIQF